MKPGSFRAKDGRMMSGSISGESRGTVCSDNTFPPTQCRVYRSSLREEPLSLGRSFILLYMDDR